MGLGDEMIAVGEAQELARRTGRKVAIVGRDGRQRWCELFERAPEIARPGEPYRERIVNGPNARPYIDGKSAERWTWKGYRPRPARLVHTPKEEAFAARHEGLVIIEPNVKAAASPNKRYPWEMWREVVGHLSDLPLAQLGPLGTPVLPGVRFIECPDYFHALALLRRSWAYVGHEGGLHHGAAAAGIPTVVVMGGYIGPEQTGYGLPNHRYLTGGADPCGSRVACPHCSEAMRSIAPGAIANAVREVLT